MRFSVNYDVELLGHPTLVGKALSFTHELTFLSFHFVCQSTALSISYAVDGHQMYSGDLVVG